jgi:outer membrane protein assembly factor BamB
MSDLDCPPSPRRGRPWFPLVTIAVGGLAVLGVFLKPEFERNLTWWLVTAISALVIVLNGIWLLVTPRIRGRHRLVGLAVVLVVGIGLKFSLRGNGTGLPKLAWRWSSERVVLAVPVGPPKGAVAVDPARLAMATDVPQFFGPTRDGVVRGARLARDWKSHPPRELWRQPIGEGWSAFAVVDGLAYTQEQRGAEELVSCYDLFSGELRWAHADPVRFSQWQSGDGPHATPTVVEGRVYAYGATGLLNCLDALTGAAIWQRSVLEEHQLGNLEWGLSASPLVLGDRVVVSGGKEKGSVLFAYDRLTGAPLWKGGSDSATYASPMAVTLAGREIILSSHARALTAHDPVTGEVLLEYAWGMDKVPKASQPVMVGADRVLVSAGYGMGCLLLQIKPGQSNQLEAEELWSHLRLKTQFNSVAQREGHLYGLDDGRLCCLEVASGERLWKEGRFGSGQSLLVDDLVIVQSESGAVHLAAAQPSGYEELGRVEALSSKTWNHPVLAGRFLLLRNDREAVCYELAIDR